MTSNCGCHSPVASTGRLERRHVLEAVPQGRPVRVGVVLLDPAGHRLRTVEREDRPRAWIGVEAVREARLLAGGFVGERQPVESALHLSGHAGRVLARLDLDLGKGGALGLSLDGPDGLTLDEQQVVRSAVTFGHRELASGNSTTGVEVQLGPVLDEPPASHELPVDLDPRLGFGGQICRIGRRLLSPSASRLTFRFPERYRCKHARATPCQRIARASAGHRG